MAHLAASAIYLLNLRGEIIIYRTYRSEATRSLADAFRTQIVQAKDTATSPVRQLAGFNFCYIRCNNVYVLTVTKCNANAALAFKFMVQVTQLLKSYFNKFDEESIRNNFVLIYELLDEVLDYGYPQILSPDILKLYITQSSVRSFIDKAKEPVDNRATLQVTGAVGHRRDGIRYKKNEVYLDIIESVNLLMSAKGTVLRSDCSGKLMMKCFLSGMPDLKLGLNDKLTLESEGGTSKTGSKLIELDDVTFHQCVNLSRFHTDRCVSFVPPDGEFELMKYRITEGIHLPFRVLPIIKEHGRTRIECNVKIKSTFPVKLFAIGVVVRVPVPKQTARATIQVSSGKAKYNAADNCLVWKIRRFPGQTELGMSAEVELVSTTTEKKAWARPPINLEFQVPMFTSSGLRVRFLKVWEKGGYNTVKWVRCVTRAGADFGGNYEIRCS
uniref:MHD domain-containing protein n=1 Tax=Pyramimonas obovata TaxID=1411642 RepID=A0A7S0N9W6_9CHLO|mmetsp:Transcript_23169/g.50768  ORF Transcript_23169/g.50768 Transcript_23169/m.50768 type:complete len:441 (+) Transcript_23169:343-1665(+)